MGAKMRFLGEEQKTYSPLKCKIVNFLHLSLLNSFKIGISQCLKVTKLITFSLVDIILKSHNSMSPRKRIIEHLIEVHFVIYHLVGFGAIMFIPLN